MKRAVQRIAIMVASLACLLTAPADAQTRRALLVGINNYSDGNLQKLRRAVDDVKDLETDLQQVGFDKKNIKRLEDIKSKSAFDKEFDAFLKTIQPGDAVVFFFSGHGFGVDSKAENYLLMGDLKSPYAFTQAKLTAEERKNPAIVRLRIAGQLDDYNETEIARSGVSVREVQDKIAARKPKAAILILDACRSLVSDEALDSKTMKRSAESGSRLLPVRDIPPGFLVLYSASFGEQAIESLNQFDRRRNSLFTEVVRQELMRPGQTAVDFARRVKLVTRAIALKQGAQQEPEFYQGFDKADDFYFVASIGRERFKRAAEACEGSQSEIEDIKKQPRREALERHIRRFDMQRSGERCGSVEEARRLLSAIALGSDEISEKCDGSRSDLIDSIRQFTADSLDRHSRRFEGCPSAEAAIATAAMLEPPADASDDTKKCFANFAQVVRQPRRETLERHLKEFPACATQAPMSAILTALPPGSDELGDARITRGTLRRIDDCDYFAASEQDRARPPEVTGVVFQHMKYEDAIQACEKSVKENPRIGRYMFNLGRAYHRKGWDTKTDPRERAEVFRKAGFAYSDAEKRGYVSALNGLAVLYLSGDGLAQNEEEAVRLLRQASQQGHPLAMFNLAIRFLNGTGVQRDIIQAYELFARSAESGYVPAMTETGVALRWGRGVPANPRRAVETLSRAADAGSVRAKQLLGMLYRDGGWHSDTAKAVLKDDQLALLWFSRAADSSDVFSRKMVGFLMDDGKGLPAPQPELAERYWRLAAYSGDGEAQFTFAEKLLNGSVLSRPENGGGEAIALLEKAMAQGSAPAAVRLAQIYRNGEQGQAKNPQSAIEYAFRAIDLATQSDPMTWDGNPFREIVAGHLLAEMIANGEAVDSRGRPLFTKEEVSRIETFYGKPDPVTNQVRVRRVEMPFYVSYDPKGDPKSRIPAGRYNIWVWDWGRKVSPTEAQIQNIEYLHFLLPDNRPERATLIGSFEMATKSKVSFADLIEQQIKAAAVSEINKAQKKR